MKASFAKKLIWQSDSPAPYESGWSIFIKLIAYNLIKPNQLAAHISLSKIKNPKLSVDKSDWIDFEKFSLCTNVDTDRLKKGFLDQFGFSQNCQPGVGVKHCSECLKLGYHCVFFQLAFITHCPWHNLRLMSPCKECGSALNVKGLDISIESDNFKQKTKCGDVSINDLKLLSSNLLTSIQVEKITELCEIFLKWWGRVYSSIEVRSFFLEQYKFNDRFDKLPMYLSSAEALAGPCPWYIDIKRDRVRTLHWKQVANTHIYSYELYKDWRFESEIAKRKSSLDLAYRSVRRYFYRKFIKPHKVCWNELINYKYEDALNLSSDKVCTVSLAFATWRMSVENVINIEALKSRKLRKHAIIAYRINSEEFTSTLEGHTSLLYAYFFYLWELINKYSGDKKVILARSAYQSTKDNFIASYHSGEWVVAFPDFRSLELHSFTRCSGQLKEEGWMSEGYSNDYFQSLSNYDANSNGTMFKLLKTLRRTYQHINV